MTREDDQEFIHAHAGVNANAGRDLKAVTVASASFMKAVLVQRAHKQLDHGRRLLTEVIVFDSAGNFRQIPLRCRWSGTSKELSPALPWPLLFDVVTSLVRPPERSPSLPYSRSLLLWNVYRNFGSNVRTERLSAVGFWDHGATGVGSGLHRVMAVQTAVMNPHFMNFCFPGSVMEYDVEKSLDGSLLGEAENEEDYRETTRDLLSFIDSASSNIKLALDKPVKSKRKVNHRKYLQKQIKRCTGMITQGSVEEAPVRRQGSPPTQPSPPPSKTPPKRDGVQANLQSKSLAALFSPVKDVRGEKAKKPPLRHRNLPPSFFTEPANCSKVSSTSGMTLKDLERGNPDAADFFELLGPDYSNMIGEQDLYQGAPVRAQPEVASPDPASYDCHHLVSGLLYAEPWTGSAGPAKKLGPAQPSLCCHPEAAAGPLEDGALCTLAFPNFFTDCSIPQVTYDLSAGYNRANYSSL